MSKSKADPAGFEDLGLPSNLLQALQAIGYEKPSPIQARTIPFLLEGRDLIGQAQTGTGKTAAFALPLLARLDLKEASPQVLVLCPTRELAIQVAESFQSYARKLKGFHVLPIYGGQAYSMQLRPLKRGVHVVVGTPGRVMDHMRRGSLKLDGLRALVLDEADEMLRMGFIDDVNWILERTPDERQVALFSATMPEPIRRIAQQHLRDPEEVLTKVAARTASTIDQRYQVVSRPRKLDALTRILEAEDFEAMLVFVRTRNSTDILAEKLEARGYAARALSGDVSQAEREKVVERLKSGTLNILVATDVAARGLDVDRISHVINFDVPTDPEAYVHRIGRTGRAGREGKAILFVTPRERRMLRILERTTQGGIEEMTLPTTAEVNLQRARRFKRRVLESLERPQGLEEYARLLEELLGENPEVDPRTLSAVLARLAQGEQPLWLEEKSEPKAESFRDGKRERRRERDGRGRRDDKGGRFERKGGPKGKRGKPAPEPSREKGMVRYRVEVGHNDGVRPGSLVGAIANEAGLEGRYIGRIEIYDDFSTVDLPDGMPRETFKALQQARVCNRKLRISALR